MNRLLIMRRTAALTARICPSHARSTQATLGHRYSTARISKRPTDESAACLRARYCADLAWLDLGVTCFALKDSIVNRYQFMFERVDDGLCAMRQVELTEDVTDVSFHGLFTNGQRVGDFAVGISPRELAQDFYFALGQFTPLAARDIVKRISCQRRVNY